MNKLLVFFLPTLLILSFAAKAQIVTGHWYGVGKVDLPGSSNIYMSELALVQKGRQISGFFNYYFRDSLFSNKITGSFDASSRRLVINPTQLIHHSSTSTTNGIDCPMSGEFILRVAKAESVLTGTMISNKSYRFTCPPINFKLKIATDTPEMEVAPTPKQDTVAKVIVPPKPFTPEEKDKLEQLNKRGKVYFKEIEVTGSVLKLEFYDNGSIDNDSIAVFFNNRMVISKAKLDYKAVTVTINMDDDLPFNELAMFAESVGTIPPNTAVLVIYDGSKRYDVLMSSDLNNTATIKLTRKKE
ncbi:MAG: hypothetical protein H7178_02785 [Chitinophagaceae bacterium]|nr:hypothetical protein [Chitinophagaceae bacterium]